MTIVETIVFGWAIAGVLVLMGGLLWCKEEPTPYLLLFCCGPLVWIMMAICCGVLILSDKIYRK
jgi:hypothetical protein